MTYDPKHDDPGLEPDLPEHEQQRAQERADRLADKGSVTPEEAQRAMAAWYLGDVPARWEGSE